MAALEALHPTLLDVTRRLDPQGNIDPNIVEILVEENPVLEDAVVIEGNLPTGHRTTLRTSQPTPTWRRINGFVAPTKSTTAQITDTCGSLEAFSEVDVKAAAFNGNTRAWRLSEDRPHVAGMSEEVADTFFHGNESTEPEAFTGLLPRYNSTTGEQSSNVFADSASDTDATSLWLVAWGGNDGVRLIYPKGSMAGLQVEDLGKKLIQGDNIGSGTGGRQLCYVTHFAWEVGLAVPNWRCVVRLNYDPDDVTATGSTGPVFDTYARKMVRRLPRNGRGYKLAWYCNRDTLDMLDWQAANKTTLAFKTIEDAQGKLVTTLLGIPVRQCDAITTAESSIV